MQKFKKIYLKNHILLKCFLLFKNTTVNNCNRKSCVLFFLFFQNTALRIDKVVLFYHFNCFLIKTGKTLSTPVFFAM